MVAYGVHLGLGDLPARKQPYHQLRFRVVVETFVTGEIPASALGALPHEEGAVPDSGLELRILRNVDAAVEFKSLNLPASGTAAFRIPDNGHKPILLEFAGAVGNDYVVDLRSVTELLGEFLYCGIYEVLIEFFLHKVDGAAAEAASHYP